jgi:uncharacterized protein (TIGR02147 family)
MSYEAVNIYDYQSPRQFLLDRVNALQKSDPELSARALSRKMGFKSHALLLMLLHGKRPLRVKHAPLLARGLGLSSQERLFLQALIQFDNAEDIEEKQLCSLWLSDLHPEGRVKTRQIDEFEMISNWIHMAILSLCETSDFDPKPEAIARRLGKKVAAQEVRAAIERLKTLKLIEMNPDGSFHSTQNQVQTADDVASRGARKYHKEVMSLAADALEKVPLSRREFQSFAISIPDAKVSLAKELIRKFRSQFAKAMGVEPGDEVYQLSIQFFQLTESPARMVRTEDEGAATGSNKLKQGEIPC